MLITESTWGQGRLFLVTSLALSSLSECLLKSAQVSRVEGGALTPYIPETLAFWSLALPSFP